MDAMSPDLLATQLTAGKGMSPAITDLMAGQVQVLLVSLTAVEAQMQSGRLRAIGVSSPQRSAFLPNLPAIAETLPGYDLVTWYAVFLPRRTPPVIVNRLHAELVKILVSPAIERQFAQNGVEPINTTPQELTAYMRAETERWGKVIRTSGIRLE